MNDAVGSGETASRGAHGEPDGSSTPRQESPRTNGWLRHAPRAVRLSPQRAFLLLRYTLIVATAYLLLVEESLRPPPTPAILLIVLALASNVAIAVWWGRLATAPSFGPAVLVADTAWITAALLISGRFHGEFFFLYFFILLIAAIGENLWLIALAGIAVCGAYLYVLSAMGGQWSWWTSPSLIRLPFLFTTAAFFGYLVDRARMERRRAHEADRIKSEFLGTISHELRTPLTVILGYVDLLLDDEFGPLAAEQRIALDKIQAAGGNLHHYLTRLLDVSRLVNRLESGRETVVCSEFTLAAVFGGLRYDFPDPAAGQIQWPSVAALPPLYTDREKLSTIVRNLVENALKYGNRTPAVIRVDYDPATEVVAVSVADRGLGISADDLPHIFDPFRRTVQAAAANAQGVGLGLYIVKQLTELLRGTIEVESARGVGSTFVVRIPRQLQRPPAHPRG